MNFWNASAISRMILCCALSFSFAQQPKPDEAVTISVQSSLVLVDVFSQNPQNGLPVRDMKKEDFRVLDNDHEVSIASFEAGALRYTAP